MLWHVFACVHTCVYGHMCFCVTFCIHVGGTYVFVILCVYMCVYGHICFCVTVCILVCVCFSQSKHFEYFLGSMHFQVVYSVLYPFQEAHQ